MKSLSLHILAAATLLCSSEVTLASLEGSAKDLAEEAENVCINQEVQSQLVNLTFIQSVDEIDYTWCLKVPPRCRVYRTKLVTRWKEENVTRVVNVRSCCPGYESDGKGYCKAICSQSCGQHGHCAEPEVCRCDPGFSGHTCQEVGCPGGRWGPDCTNDCPCQNGGRCEPYTGKCLCPPGWKGVHCQNRCDQNKYGQDCAETCSCQIGQRCHHVSGECLPCSPGTYGAQCAKTCSCSANGTALCLHTSGQCFCTANWYGNTCNLHCPFGYVDGICHTSPIEGQICVCPSDQMICDHDKGCLCKEGGDCGGGQRLLDLTRAAPLEESDESSASSTTAIVLSVVFLTLATVVLVVIYYRRRLKRMQKDLQNRSVYYVENSILDPARHHNHDLVVTDQEPLPEDPTTVVAHQMRNNLPNNNRVVDKPEKNVNIDRFKLHDEEPEVEGASCQQNHVENCMSTTAADGACAAAAIEEKDINVYDEKCSPSKEKNNFLLDNSRKINKASVDLVFNNLAAGKEEKDEDDENNLDDIAIAKMTSYLNQEPRK